MQQAEIKKNLPSGPLSKDFYKLKPKDLFTPREPYLNSFLYN